LDDLQSITSKNDAVTDLFTEGSHHRNLSVISIQQTLYPSGHKSCTQRRNALYTVLFKSPQDKRQIMCFAQQMYPHKYHAQQMYPHKYHAFMNMYDMATMRPHGYLIIDATQMTPENERLKTNIFGEKVKDKVTDKVTDMVTDKVTDKVMDKVTDKVTVTDMVTNETQPKVAPQQYDIVSMIQWLTCNDPHIQPPDLWTECIQSYVGNDKTGINNPFALGHIAAAECEKRNTPHSMTCNKCGNRDASSFYMHTCPKCKFLEMYFQRKSLELVACKQCNHICNICKKFQVYYCPGCEEAVICKNKRTWTVDLNNWAKKVIW
jgi:hypothetical protein